VIIRENTLKVDDIADNLILVREGIKLLPDDMIFFDLEHYVYKKPKCIGVFGACIYNSKLKELQVTQYMIENRRESINILHLAKKYFVRMKNTGKNSIVTFSGNNDFTVINYLFEKFGIDYDFKMEFNSIDIQKEYEREKSTSIGLKNLEKVFGIIRQSEVISGSNLAKTFHKVMKDNEYVTRMPKEKLNNILLYNEQDVVNLYHILVNWNNFIFEEPEADEEPIENIDNEPLEVSDEKTLNNPEIEEL
jgi:uncharacterized protein YprB with RNaseH-like and TPR domain